MEGQTTSRTIKFRTAILLSDAYHGLRRIKTLLILPLEKQQWNYTDLTAFLNEISDFEPAIRRPIREIKEGAITTYVFTFVHHTNPTHKIFCQYCRKQYFSFSKN